MIITELWIPGRPITKGSLTRMGTALSDTPQSKAWRRIMAGAIRDDLARRTSVACLLPYPGPVVVSTAWFLPVDPLALHAGDIDKLLRNLLDALSAPTPRTTDASLCAGAIRDDNQIQADVDSWEFGPDVNPGVAVFVRTLSLLEIETKRKEAERWRARLM